MCLCRSQFAVFQDGHKSTSPRSQGARPTSARCISRIGPVGDNCNKAPSYISSPELPRQQDRDEGSHMETTECTTFRQSTSPHYFKTGSVSQTHLNFSHVYGIVLG